MHAGPYELIAYEVSDSTGWQLLPAARRRPWMDATPNGFANRCLPLSMANHAGWVVSCPTPFTATWNGSADPSGVDIVFADGNLDRRRSITSHFGSGIVTLNLPYLFRTPPGIGLLVRGLPNSGKAHCYALEGFVETDWASATFTVNWKIVTPDVPVSFVADEPVCFLQPVDIGLIECAEPVLQPLQSSPETEKEYLHWQRSRTAFNADPDRGLSWQKDYYLGKTLATGQVPEHRTALRVGRFRRV